MNHEGCVYKSHNPQKHYDTAPFRQPPCVWES